MRAGIAQYYCSWIFLLNFSETVKYWHIFRLTHTNIHTYTHTHTHTHTKVVREKVPRRKVQSVSDFESAAQRSDGVVILDFNYWTMAYDMHEAV